ncbi:Uncharacterised protein [uncultured archaeon]|nr:Uncharacterised protein [uncultured archaeon]
MRHQCGYPFYNIWRFVLHWKSIIEDHFFTLRPVIDGLGKKLVGCLWGIRRQQALIDPEASIFLGGIHQLAFW